MGLFGKKKQQPAPAQPEQKPVEISGPPHMLFVMVDGQWYNNPNYDPNAPKPAQPRVIGLDPDDDDDDDDD
jgi:hypothetical protein